MSLIPGWILVIPILTFLVFVHELGHFAVAKKLGIKVTEFGFGFPPRIWGIKRGETLYSVNIIPLGGFVKMVGEEDPSEQRSFARQPVIHRMAVLLAGCLLYTSDAADDTPSVDLLKIAEISLVKTTYSGACLLYTSPSPRDS